jgi:hypothetical protein
MGRDCNWVELVGLMSGKDWLVFPGEQKMPEIGVFASQSSNSQLLSILFSSTRFTWQDCVFLGGML